MHGLRNDIIQKNSGSNSCQLCRKVNETLFNRSQKEGLENIKIQVNGQKMTDRKEIANKFNIFFATVKERS